jgi:tRNA modification GTPase
MTDAIAAISTPPGEGAVALIRVSGPRAIQIADGIFRGAAPLADLPARKLHFGRIIARGAMVDEVLVATFRGPHSYTGEEMVEINCHGGILLSAKILELLLKAGARAAEPGEFTQRAFLNGKMDLTQAEAVMDLIRAQTPLALRAAAEQLEGRIGVEIEAIRADVLGIVAHIEAFIDFPDEGIDPDTGRALLERIHAARARVEQLLATAGDGRVFREGVRLAICGRPNAGKSSLLNRLVGFDRAIVNPTPGTTRDTIEELVSLRGIPFRIVDTAGLRETGDSVEREGVARARRAIESADIVLHVIDATDPAPDVPIAPDEIRALNKSDLLPSTINHQSSTLPVSCLTGSGLPELVDAVVARAGHAHLTTRDSLAAINARHQACLDRTHGALRRAGDALASDIAPEFIALDLRIALDSLGEVVGAVNTEEILGAIFGAFCIGK